MHPAIQADLLHKLNKGLSEFNAIAYIAVEHGVILSHSDVLTAISSYHIDILA